MNKVIDLSKKQDENSLQYVWRICSLKDNGLLDATWDDVADMLNLHLCVDQSEYLKPSTYRNKYQQAKLFYDDVFSKMTSDECSDSIHNQIATLRKERYKLQTEKLEQAKWFRDEARDELFEEKVINAIRETLTIPSRKPEIKIVESSEREGILCLADSHFGKEFVIRGLDGNVLNEYSPDIFFSRMDQIFSDIVNLARKEGLHKIKVFNLGDSVEGFIRNSQIWTLKYGVIDSAIKFADYMGDWLYELSNFLKVEYYQTDGNHDELRLLDGKKGQHLNESAGKVIHRIIDLKNEQNPNVSVIWNNTGYIYTKVCGYNILGIHGEIKNATSAIMEFEHSYAKPISYLIYGHKHHGEYNNCGIRNGCIGIGSIIGIDDFSMKIRKVADPTASLLIFEKGKGKVTEHTIVLN